ncbi:hypothetical protein REH65_22305 [Saccharopolyspora sp. ID03-671]|uniref:hypothetical protein n=1 Tax=Saccharopolyspora sp. ID03-671 TaxID=3073066 RepID=UPI00325038E8
MGDEFHEVLRGLLSSVGDETDPGRVEDDGHLRYQLYKQIVDAWDGRGELLLLVESISTDPDPVMAGAAATDVVDAVARACLSSGEFEDWVSEYSGFIAKFDFARKRSEEWFLYRRVLGGESGAIDEALAGTDWLQKRIAAECDLIDVLERLSEEGRTKRIRSSAAQRLVGLRSKG